MTGFTAQLSLTLSSNVDVDVIHESIQRHEEQLVTGFWEYPDVILPYLYGSLLLRHKINTERAKLHRSIEVDCLRNANIWNGDKHDKLELVTLFGNHLNGSTGLPPKLQLELVKEGIFIDSVTNGKVFEHLLQWLRIHWEAWHESLVKKKKQLFEYKMAQRRQRNEEVNTEEEEEEEEDPAGIDEEMAEIEALLPDFSKVKEREEESRIFNILKEDEVIGIARAVLSSKSPKDVSAGYLPSSYLLGQSLYGNTDDLLLHVINLLKVKNSLSSAVSEVILNVYEENDTQLVINCVKQLKALTNRVDEILALFPENVILKNIMESVETFVNCGADHPLMYYTSMLERVLERTELWEANTCREYSLNDYSIPLKQTILEWRKLEVICWENILTHANTLSHYGALLASWPLISSFTDFNETSEVFEKNLVVLMTEWFTNASLNDLKARLESGDMIVKWLKLSKKREGVLPKVEGVIRYYKQYLQMLDKKVEPFEAEAKEKLEALVKVAKYTDLNLWSVKDSTQRVHNQICRIIHAYKVNNNFKNFNLIIIF